MIESQEWQPLRTRCHAKIGEQFARLGRNFFTLLVMRLDSGTPNRFWGRNKLPAENELVARKLEERLVQKDSGLFVVFEQQDVECESTSPQISFYVSRTALENSGPELGTPPVILQYFDELHWAHFVWLPSFITNGHVEQFTMHYAHELHHYRQGLKPELVRSARAFLNELRRGGWHPCLSFERLPNEFDAHRNALLEFQAIHGAAALNKYIERECRDETMARFYNRLAALITKWGETFGGNA